MKQDKFHAYQNRFRLGELFLETNQDVENGHKFAIYTTQDNDRVYKGRTFKSAKKIYLECSDPTEYKAVKKLFASWAHWQALQECVPLKPHILKWREELEVKVKSDAINNLVEISMTEKGASSAKWLAECGWKGKHRGRPTKNEIEGALEKDKKDQKALDEYAERLDLESTWDNSPDE